MYREEGVSYPWPLFTRALLVWLARMSVGERVRALRTPIYCGTASPESKSLPTFNDLWPWQDAPICTLPPPFTKEEGRRKFPSTSSNRFTPLSSSFVCSFFDPFLHFYENILLPRLFISLTRFRTNFIPPPLSLSLYIHIYLFFYFLLIFHCPEILLKRASIFSSLPKFQRHRYFHHPFESFVLSPNRVAEDSFAKIWITSYIDRITTKGEAIHVVLTHRHIDCITHLTKGRSARRIAGRCIRSGGGGRDAGTAAAAVTRSQNLYRRSMTPTLARRS